LVPEDVGGNGGGDLEGGGGGEPLGGGGGGGPGGGGGESEGGREGAGVPEKGEARTEEAPKRSNPPLSDGPLPTEAHPPPPLDFAPTVAQPEDFFGPPPPSAMIGAGARGAGDLDEVLVEILMP
jgi:hypothetical protein